RRCRNRQAGLPRAIEIVSRQYDPVAISLAIGGRQVWPSERGQNGRYRRICVIRACTSEWLKMPPEAAVRIGRQNGLKWAECRPSPLSRRRATRAYSGHQIGWPGFNLERP